MEISFSVGKKFLSYSALESKIEQYQRSSCVQFYKRSLRTIPVANSRCPKKTFNEALKVSEITFSCIHGGKTFKTECTGKRNPR